MSRHGDRQGSAFGIGDLYCWRSFLRSRLFGGRRPAGCSGLVVILLDSGSAAYRSGRAARIRVGLVPALMRFGLQRGLIAQGVVIDLPAPFALELLALQPPQPHKRSQIASDRFLVATQQLRQFDGCLPYPFDALVHDAAAQAQAAPDLLKHLSPAAADLGCQ